MCCLQSTTLDRKKNASWNRSGIVGSDTSDAPEHCPLGMRRPSGGAPRLAAAKVLATHLAAERMARSDPAAGAMVTTLHQSASEQLSVESKAIRGISSYTDAFIAGILEKVSQYRVHFQRPLAVLVGTRVLLYIDDPAGMECVLNAPECLDKTFLQDGFFVRRGLLHARGKYLNS